MRYMKFPRKIFQNLKENNLKEQFRKPCWARFHQFRKPRNIVKTFLEIYTLKGYSWRIFEVLTYLLFNVSFKNVDVSIFYRQSKLVLWCWFKTNKVLWSLNPSFHDPVTNYTWLIFEINGTRNCYLFRNNKKCRKSSPRLTSSPKKGWRKPRQRSRKFCPPQQVSSQAKYTFIPYTNHW